jgi:opacity protein-like surface antigen
VYPSGDTTFQYVLDSTYVPQTVTAYAYRDVNRLSYLNVGLFVSYDFVKSEYVRAFVKAGVSLDVLVGCAGSFIANASPYHTDIERSQVQPIRFSYYGGLGVAFKVANSLELVPEVHYRVTSGSLYRVDYPFDLKMRSVDFRLGLTYYF